jgi:SAM-dependent methyltransferase
VGAGRCAVSLELLERGHQVVAADTDLDPDDGLVAASHAGGLVDRLVRVEAEMEAIPFEPGSFDLVVAVGALHHAPQVSRALIELRRVTCREGVLLAWNSPVFRRRPDGEVMVGTNRHRQAQQFGIVAPRESEAGYLELGELPSLFASAGWTVTPLRWPGRVAEAASDALARVRFGRRPARYPVLLARRDA